MKKIKIVFMGSPEFAIPSLTGLMKQFSVVGIVTQPDKPAGRGKALKAPPIKEIALSNNIECIQPQRLCDEGVYDKLRFWDPDFIVVVAFGQILRQDVLDIPKSGCINVHGSLLPRWRGAAPIQAAILNGDEETGITIMKMDAGIDTGPILRQRSMKIKNDDTSESLGKYLSQLGADLLLETLPDYLHGKINAIPQPEFGATYAPMIKKEDGFLDFSKSATELNRQIRAYYPWPGTFMEIGGERIKVLAANIVEETHLKPGERGLHSGFPMVGTNSGGLVLESVQPAGKKPMPGKIFLNGFRDWISK
ncbi:MAG: methionyl-tRNA formyltransferase [Anaerolineaceae bacterium]|jgi:methionyl-tRNA formyltransferase|nr:methionyl-tRNA formyltransferase [Anaerolineaceae bacterium]